MNPPLFVDSVYEWAMPVVLDYKHISPKLQTSDSGNWGFSPEEYVRFNKIWSNEITIL